MPAPDDVAASLQRWAGEAEVVEGPMAVGGGFDTYIYRFRLADGPPLILRLYPTPSRGPSADREAATLAYQHATGFPAPAVLTHASGTDDFGLPFLVMEEAPGRTALDAFRSRPRRAPRLVESLAAAQASIHGLPVDGWPHTGEAVDEIDRRLAELGDRRPSDPAIAAAVDWLVANADAARGEEPVVCHQDFHPVNVLVDDDGRLTVIDWENARLGSRHSDLARTLVIFEYGPAVAGSIVERTVLRAAKPWLVRGYRDAYARHLAVDEARLRFWIALHAVDGWWEATSLLDGTFDRATRTDERRAYAERLAPAMAKLVRRQVPESGRTAHYAP
jgi:aminoglycoside phosphotransferase (APT) family kinase protein